MFYSGAGQPSDVEVGLAAGAQAYVVKPDVERLRNVVARLVERNASGE